MFLLVLLFFGKLSAYEFIKGIILYNDKIEIYYNTDKKVPDDENRRAFSFYCETYFTKRKLTDFVTNRSYKIIPNVKALR